MPGSLPFLNMEVRLFIPLLTYATVAKWRSCGVRSILLTVPMTIQFLF
jgi:hypothetical protein